MFIVQVCDFGVDGDAHYRVHSPSRYLASLDDVTVIDCHPYHRHLPDVVERADVLVLQFVSDWDLLGLCAHRRAAGKVTIFEANDFFFDIQPWNPIADAWQDREMRELYRRLLCAADAVQTSSHWLADRWRECGAREVVVFENQLATIPTLQEKGTRPFTIGWAGSPGHFADWYAMSAVLRPWLEQHQDVHVAVMCNEVVKDFIRLPAERYRFTPFGSIDDYYAFLGNLDVGLAPLLPSDYNRGRSDVKYIEYASHGVVGIYSDVEPYRGSVVDGETGVIAESFDAMLPHLDRLREDSTAVMRMRQQAHQAVSSERRIESHIGKRLEWYRGLLIKAGIQPMPGGGYFFDKLPTVGAHIAMAAHAEGRYLQLRPGKTEDFLLNTLKIAKPADSVRALASLVQAEPHYWAAHEVIGQKLNDGRLPAAAKSHLESAIALKTWGSRAELELGRSCFQAGDRDEAQRIIRECVKRTPDFLPAWKALLRFSAAVQLPEAQAIAAEARQLFPLCYTVALIASEIGSVAEQAESLLGALDAFAPSISEDERFLARPEFVRAVRAFVRRWPQSEHNLAVLKRASEIFPESAHIVIEAVTDAHLRGDFQSELLYQRRLHALFQNAEVIAKELGALDECPVMWDVADFLLRFN